MFQPIYLIVFIGCVFLSRIILNKAYQKLSCEGESKNKYNTLVFSNNRKCCSVKPVYKTLNKPFRMTGADRSGTKIAQAKYNAKTRGNVSEPYYNFF